MRKTNIAIIGTGHWGPNLIRNFNSDPRVQLKKICDIDADRAKAVAVHYRDLEATSNIDEILHDPSIHAIVICTPTATHFDIARAALAKGKHVFIEKPMATSSDECEQLVRLAAQKHLKLMVGHVFLYNPAIQYIEKLIHDGELGKIVYIYGTRVNLGPIRKDVNALWDLAPHDIAIVNYWLKSSPTFSHAVGIKYVDTDLHDVVFASLKYPQNILVSLHVSWMDPRKIRQIVVVGTKKMVVFDDLNPVGPIHIYDKSVKRLPTVQPPLSDTIQAFKVIVQEGDLVVPKIAPSEPLREECRQFIDWLLDNVEPLSTGQNGLEVVKVLEALTSSLLSSDIEEPDQRSLFATAPHPPVASRG